MTPDLAPGARVRVRCNLGCAHPGTVRAIWNTCQPRVVDVEVAETGEVIGFRVEQVEVQDEDA